MMKIVTEHEVEPTAMYLNALLESFKTREGAAEAMAKFGWNIDN